MLDRLQDEYRAFKRFFKNVYLWYPILISDEQWDSGYVYDVLNHKLKIMEEFFRGENTNTLHILKYADEIKEARIILDRLIEDDYMSDESNEYYSNIDLSEMFSDEPMSEDTKKDVMRWFKEEEKARDDDKKDLFDLLYKKLDGWWD